MACVVVSRVLGCRVLVCRVLSCRVLGCRVLGCHVLGCLRVVASVRLSCCVISLWRFVVC